MRNNQNKTETSLFKKSGPQFNKWLLKNIRLDPEEINYDFKLAIDGISGRGYQGDIGIDESNFSYFQK